MIAEVIVAYLLLHSSGGISFVTGFATVFTHLMNYAAHGTNFVFGNLVNGSAFSFFLNVLMPIVFISGLIGVLQYLRVLTYFIKGIGWVLAKISGMGKLESFNAVSSLTLGQSENFMIYKKVMGAISDRRMYTLAATGMSTVSMAIVGAYMKLIPPEYVVTALVLNMFSTFIVLRLINPYDYEAEQDVDELFDYRGDHQSFFEMFGEYLLGGFKIAIIIAAMLIGFVALISMLNDISLQVFGLSFQDILGYAFAPLAWMLHIPNNEILQAGNIMATKIVSNEIVAMFYLKKHIHEFSAHSIAVISVFLVSFANFGSIGVIAGTIHGLNEEKGKFVARYGLRLLLGATMVSFLSALIVSIII